MTLPILEHVGAPPAFTLGHVMRRLRERAKLPLGALARQLSLSVVTLSAWETGRAIWTWESLVSVAEALGVSPEDVFQSRFGVVFSMANAKHRQEEPGKLVQVSSKSLRELLLRVNQLEAQVQWLQTYNNHEQEQARAARAWLRHTLALLIDMRDPTALSTYIQKHQASVPYSFPERSE